MLSSSCKFWYRTLQSITQQNVVNRLHLGTPVCELSKVTSKVKFVFVFVPRALPGCKQIPKGMSCLPPPRVCVRLYAHMTRLRTSTHKMKIPGLLAHHNCINVWRNIAYLLVVLWGAGLTNLKMRLRPDYIISKLNLQNISPQIESLFPENSQK